MTGMFGAVWTGLQSIAWLLYFLSQLISDTLNVNYRLVSTLGHIIAGIAKAVYMLFSFASLALYEIASYVLSTISGIILFLIDCLSFVVHLCTLLFKIIYYIASSIMFVAVAPFCACQTIHSWVIWIFNTEHWLNAATWCLRTCSNALSLVGENTRNLIFYLATAVSCWMFAVATFTYEHTMLLCCIIYNGLTSLSTAATESILFVLFQFWNFIALLPSFLSDSCLMLVVNPVRGLLDLCGVSSLCLISISLTVFITTLLFILSHRLLRLIPSFLGHSAGEVIRINLNDVDIIDVSDDEQGYIQGHAANMFDFAEDDEDTEEGDSDPDESNMAESSEGETDSTGIVTDSDVDDSDAETIDVQLPDQLNTAFLAGPCHGYATRSKDTEEGDSDPDESNMAESSEGAVSYTHLTLPTILRV